MRAFKRLTSLFTKRKAQSSPMPAASSRLIRALNPWAAVRDEREAAILYMTLAAEVVGKVENELNQLRAATEDLATLFDDGMLADGVAGHLTCPETNQLAKFFQDIGHPHIAAVWLECHAIGDDEGDLHYQGERSEPVELVIAA